MLSFLHQKCLYGHTAPSLRTALGHLLVPLTRTLASVRFVHTAISSLVLISGYRFLWKVASSSCSCWLVKWVRCRRCFFFFGSSAFPSSLLCSALLSFSVDHKSKPNKCVLLPVGNWHFYIEIYKCNVWNGKRFIQNLKSDRSRTPPLLGKTFNMKSKMRPRRETIEKVIFFSTSGSHSL